MLGGDPAMMYAASAPLPPVDRWQYVEGWPSGYGWRESVELLEREKGEGGRPLRVVTTSYPLRPRRALSRRTLAGLSSIS